VKPLPKISMESTKAAMKEAGQDTKEAYNRTLEKQAKLTKMKPALKAGFFVLGMSHFH
jgi:hypothetical protein